jgi:hypothetical protein
LVEKFEPSIIILHLNILITVINDKKIFNQSYVKMDYNELLETTTDEDKVFKNIYEQKCTFSVTGEELTLQMFYHCSDCGLDQEGDAICASCVRMCHKGHKIKYIGLEECFCDCVIFFKLNQKGSWRRKRKLWLLINFLIWINFFFGSLIPYFL